MDRKLSKLQIKQYILLGIEVFYIDSKILFQKEMIVWLFHKNCLNLIICFFWTILTFLFLVLFCYSTEQKYEYSYRFFSKIAVISLCVLQS